MADAQAITPGNRARFWELLEARRLDLGITTREVARRGDLTYEVLRSIRAGAYAAPRRLTMRKIDKALGWVPGSTERVLCEGGDPVETDVPDSGADGAET